jgi:heterotetrameric sarcosine oxidase gamma subunit
MNIAGWNEFIDAPPGTALQQAGMMDRSFDSTTITLHELVGTTLLRIHSLQEFDALKASMAACGIALPARVNDSMGQDPAVLCQAPREWLLFSQFLSATQLLEQMQPALERGLDGQHTAALDLSSALTVFRLGGSAAPWLLNKLCGLDFQRGSTGGAHTARTRLQHAAVTLHYHPAGDPASTPVFDLIFERSMAVYLWQLLVASVPHAEQLNQLYGTRP